MSTLQVRAAKAITELCTLHNEPRYKIGWIEQTALREACQVLADMIGELQRMHAALSRPCAQLVGREVILATMSQCCNMICIGQHSPGVVHNGLCRDKHGSKLGPTIYLSEATTSTDAVRVPKGYALVPIEPVPATTPVNMISAFAAHSEAHVSVSHHHRGPDVAMALIQSIQIHSWSEDVKGVYGFVKGYNFAVNLFKRWLCHAITSQQSHPQPELAAPPLVDRSA